MEELTTTTLEVISTPPSSNVTTGEYLSLSVTQLPLRVLYIIIAILGLLGNSLVVSVMLGVAKLRQKLTNIYIINQSILDLLTAGFLLLTTIFEYQGHPLTGVSGELYCYMWMGKIPIWSFMLSSTYNLVALTIERYFEIVHPIWHRLTFSKAKACSVLVAIWLLGPVFYLSYSITSSKLDGGVCLLLVIWPDQTTQQVVGVLAVLLQYLLPVAILVFCYSSMAYNLSKRMKTIQPTAGLQNQLQVPSGPASNIGQNKLNSPLSKGKKIILQTLTIVSVAFVVCTSWNQWFFLLFNVGVIGYTSFGSVFYHFSVIMLFTSCCVNPFIYVFKYRPFQNEVMKIFCKKYLEGNNAVPNTAAAINDNVTQGTSEERSL